MKNKKMIPKLLVGSLISLISMTGFAQNGTISIPSMPFQSQAQVDSYKIGCDFQNVYKPMYERAANANVLYRNQTADPQIKEQTLNTPSVAAKRTCIEGAINQINSIGKQVSTIMSILGGNTDWGSIASAAGTQLANAACNQVNSYATGAVYNSTSGVTSGINGITCSWWSRGKYSIRKC